MRVPVLLHMSHSPMSSCSPSEILQYVPSSWSSLVNLLAMVSRRLSMSICVVGPWTWCVCVDIYCVSYTNNARRGLLLFVLRILMKVCATLCTEFARSVCLCSASVPARRRCGLLMIGLQELL